MHVHRVHTAAEAVEMLTGRLVPWPFMVSNELSRHTRILAASARGLASDFDGTLTRHKSHWYFLERHLPPEYKEDQLRRRAEYHRLQTSWSEEEILRRDVEWIHSNFAFYREAKLELKHFQDAGKCCQRRQGADALFARFADCAVISHGMDKPIHAFLDHHQMAKAEVYASKVHFPGTPSCAVEDIVVSAMKGDYLAKFMNKAGLDSHQVVRMGDSWGDRKLFGPDSLNVFLLPPGEQETTMTEERIKSVNELWDQVPLLVLGSDSLLPLLHLLNPDV